MRHEHPTLCAEEMRKGGRRVTSACVCVCACRKIAIGKSVLFVLSVKTGTISDARQQEKMDTVIWVWVNIKPPGDRKFSSLVLFARVPFWVPNLDPIWPLVKSLYPQ